MTATDVLFSPFRIGAMELPNRIVMETMTRSIATEGIPGAAQRLTIAGQRAGWA